MSLSATLSSALSGLNAASRQAAIVSSNIANATTEGYARREVTLTARSTGSGQGVAVGGTTRITDRVVTGDRRVAQAAAAGDDVRAAFLAQVESALGSPEADGSLTARIAGFGAALVAAASRPDDDTRLATVADAAAGLTRHLNDATATVQEARTRADAAIAVQVRSLNDALAGVADLNAQIVRLTAMGGDASALMDRRQQMVDDISDLVPLREMDRGQGRIALYTTGGAVLLDGARPAAVGFTAAGIVTAEMTVGSGALSGLTVNGRPAGTGEGGPMAGGALAAQVALRDELAPAAQAGLDALARDLIERFAPPGPDPTLAPGEAGLFTDDGIAFASPDETGLAGRIRLNSLADPDSGGDLWRLRDGLNAAVPGPAGTSALLTALEQALTAARQPASGDVTPGLRSHARLAAEILSRLSQDRLSAETGASYTTARADALRVQELQGGVDSDRELQDLLVIEKSYAANARVMQTVDDMIDLLLGM